jgi:predicted DNA-binding transcriptional regulator AlpA
MKVAALNSAERPFFMRSALWESAKMTTSTKKAPAAQAEMAKKAAAVAAANSQIRNRQIRRPVSTPLPLKSARRTHSRHRPISKNGAEGNGDSDPESDAVPSRLLSKLEVLDRVALSFPTIWKLMREGKFPAARELGKSGKSFWLESEIEAWIAALPVREYKPADTVAA